MKKKRFEGYSDRVAIQNAIWRITNNTCIRFIKRTDEKDYVDFINERGKGCYSMIGRVKGRAPLHLEHSERGTCMKPRTLLHELLHLCGLWHEHMRYDRDNYVEILFENIPKEVHYDFAKLSPSQATTYDLPYDNKSVMHYRKDEFAMPSKISIRTKDPNYQDVIGNVEDASPNDYLKICKIYGCKKCLGNS
nr:Peptidase M12A domain containing protein [Haemonchus contortus]